MSAKSKLRDATARGEIVGVQYLRFLAALSVAYFHTGVLDPDFAWPHWLPREFGAGGVDLFFVISGFVMVLVTSGKPVGAGQFLVRRIERIAPFYWGATLLAATAGAIYPAAMIANKVDIAHVCLSLGFLPHTNPARGTITPFYGIGWTLNFEMYFYFVFAFIMLIAKTTGGRVLGMALWCAVGSTLFYLFDPQVPVARVYSNPMMAEFVAGAAIGWAYRNGLLARLPTPLAWAMLITGGGVLLSFTVGDESRILLQGSAATVTLFALLALESKGRVANLPWLARLGDATYAIYLVHPMVLSAARVSVRLLHLPVERMAVGAPGIVLITAFSVLAGLAIHLKIERPTLDFFHRQRLRRVERLSPVVSAAAPN